MRSGSPSASPSTRGGADVLPDAVRDPEQQRIRTPSAASRAPSSPSSSRGKARRVRVPPPPEDRPQRREPGGVETLACHPDTTTHTELPHAERARAGITERAGPGLGRRRALARPPRRLRGCAGEASRTASGGSDLIGDSCRLARSEIAPRITQASRTGSKVRGSRERRRGQLVGADRRSDDGPCRAPWRVLRSSRRADPLAFGGYPTMLPGISRKGRGGGSREAPRPAFSSGVSAREMIGQNIIPIASDNHRSRTPRALSVALCVAGSHDWHPLPSLRHPARN